MTGLAQHPQVAARIIVKHYRQVRVAFVVFFNCFDHCCFARQRQIKDIATRTRFQTNTIALFEFDIANPDDIQDRLVFK